MANALIFQNAIDQKGILSALIIFTVLAAFAAGQTLPDEKETFPKQNSAISKEKTKSLDIFALGIELLDKGKWTEALPIYRKLTASNPDYAWGWLGLGWSLHYTASTPKQFRLILRLSNSER